MEKETERGRLQSTETMADTETETKTDTETETKIGTVTEAATAPKQLRRHRWRQRNVLMMIEFLQAVGNDKRRGKLHLRDHHLLMVMILMTLFDDDDDDDDKDGDDDGDDDYDFSQGVGIDKD